MNKQSLTKLRNYLKENELDAVFITNDENRRYFSDFRGSDGYLLITQNDGLLITDSRYTEQAKREINADFDVYIFTTTFKDWFNELINKYAIKKLGFESQYLHYAFYERILNSCPSVELKPINSFIDTLRSIKTANEVENIIKAVKISDDAILFIENEIKAGLTEKQVAWMIERFMREQGSEILPFDVIVASGINSALPHHIPSDKVIEEHEPIVIDIGARVNGYASDLTRTIAIGGMNDEMQKIYDIVLRAQLEAENNITSGMTGAEADAIARSVINANGYDGYFGHSLGHGIGLVCHETPTVGPRSNEKLENGMVFTVEPGIYVPNLGGVRIEDTVLLKNDTITPLSQVHK